MAEKIEYTHGGKRDGAGRRRKNNGVLYARMSEVAITKLKEQANNAGVSVGQYIEKHIL